MVLTWKSTVRERKIGGVLLADGVVHREDGGCDLSLNERESVTPKILRHLIVY